MGKLSLYKTLIAPIFILMALAMAVCTWVITHHVEQGITNNAAQLSLSLVENLRSVRNYYNKYVIDDILAADAIATSHMHADDKGSIPVPATFLMEMNAENLSNDIRVSLTSPFPFAHRTDRKMDGFQAQAWDHLTTTTDRTFTALEERNGRSVFRIAVPDRMRLPVCVDCHNSHPESPMKDWKLGDIRGLIEVSLDITNLLAVGTKINLIVLAAIAAASAILLLVVHRVVKRVSAPLVTVTGAMRQLSAGEEGSGLNIIGGPREIRELASTFDVFRSHELERRHLASEVNRLAFFDALTGIPNKTNTVETLRRLIRTEDPKSTKIVVAIFDIDRFQDINNTRGHRAGDELLVQLADRVSHQIEGDEFVARLGEDEFAFIKTWRPGVSDAEIESTLEHLRIAMMMPVLLDEKEVRVCFSGGAAIYPDDVTTATELMTAADIALNRAKEEGRNQLVAYSQELSDELSQRVEMLGEIDRGLQSREFVPYFQPQVSLATGEVVGAEALVRWHHPSGQMVSPGRFIPLAEQSGLILRMGECVLRQTCRLAAQWRRKGIRFGKLAVNVSAEQFAKVDVVALIRDILAETGARPEDISVEVTESVMVGDINETIQALQAIRQMGVEVALDDFGTGYSSLSYLSQLPIDKLKIDRAFLLSLETKRSSHHIFEMISGLGKALGLKILAEGVETDDQLAVVRGKGCHELQGFLCSPAISAEEFAQFCIGQATTNDNLGGDQKTETNITGNVVTMRSVRDGQLKG